LKSMLFKEVVNAPNTVDGAAEKNHVD